MEGLGPIQLLCVAFDGNRFKGEIFPELDRLKRTEGVKRCEYCRRIVVFA